MTYDALLVAKRCNKMHILVMESDIKDVIAKLMVKNGRVATLNLIAEKTGRTRRTVTRWIEQGVPDGHTAYLVALACGIEDERALAIGHRFSRMATKAS